MGSIAEIKAVVRETIKEIEVEKEKEKLQTELKEVERLNRINKIILQAMLPLIIIYEVFLYSKGNHTLIAEQITPVILMSFMVIMYIHGVILGRITKKKLETKLKSKWK